MSNWEIIGAVLGTICFAVWVPSMVSWIRRGISIPRHIHILAAVMTCIGLGCLVWLSVAGVITLKLAIAFFMLRGALQSFLSRGRRPNEKMVHVL